MTGRHQWGVFPQWGLFPHWGVFPYETIDYKAAEDYLNRQGAKGRKLTGLYLGTLARFETGDAPYTYCVDLTYDREGEDYLQLCADAGWEHVAQVRFMDLFRSAPGEKPVPLETDSSLEARRFCQKCLRRNILVFVWSIAVIFGVVLLVQAIPTSLRPSLLLLYNGGFLVPVAGLLLVLSLLWELPTQLWYYHRSRQADRTGTDLPGRAALPARLRGLLERLNGLLFRLYPALCLLGLVTSFFSGNGRIDLPPERHGEAAAYPVVLAADLGLGQPAESIQISQGGSILASYTEYRDYTGRSSPSPGWITSNTYRCTWNWVADLLTRCLLWEERSGNANHIAHFEEPLPLEAASLGFDASWLYQNGDMTYLLLRQGKTVAVVEAPADLTTPESLAVLCQRLGLDGA